jgi:hypothetical protein
MFAPMSVVIDTIGRLYVAENGNHAIRRITTAGRLLRIHGVVLLTSSWLPSLGVVTKYAGTKGSSGFANGIAANALFNGPAAMVFDTSHNIFVADANGIRYLNITAGMLFFIRHEWSLSHEFFLAQAR